MIQNATLFLSNIVNFIFSFYKLVLYLIKGFQKRAKRQYREISAIN